MCAVTHKLLELVCVLVSSNTESMEKVHSHNFIRFEDVECVFDGQMMDDVIPSLKLVELKCSCAVLVRILTTSVVVGGGL